MNNSDKAVCKHKFVVYTRDLKDQTKPNQNKTKMPHTYAQIQLINNMVCIFGK